MLTNTSYEVQSRDWQQARRYPGNRPRRNPLLECISGIGQAEEVEKKPSQASAAGEVSKFLLYAVTGYFLLKGFTAGQKKYASYKVARAKKKHTKKVRKAERIARKIEDMGFTVRIEDPELWGR